jgi:hypothetical protein
VEILFLTFGVPYPPHGGDELKIWNLMKQLSRRHEIMLLTIVAHDCELHRIGNLRQICRGVHTIRLPLWTWLLNRRLLMAEERSMALSIKRFNIHRNEILITTS